MEVGQLKDYSELIMTDRNFILNKHFKEHFEVHRKTLEILEKKIISISELICDSLSDKKKLIWCGNGGSAADAMHLSGEFIGRYIKNRKALKSICISSDSSSLTCISNDFGYENVFSRQVEGIGEKGDILICLSTSGNSQNIISALNAANELNLNTIAFLGKNGGKCKGISKQELIIPSETTARIQEMHILIGHAICDIVEKKLNLI